MNRPPSKTTSSYWFIVISLVVLVGLFATIYSGATAAQDTKTSLLERSDSLAELLDSSQIESLNSTDSDIDKPEYQKLKHDFQQLHAINPDIRFAYLLKQSSERPDAFFLLDSENPDSEDYSYPGQPYPEGNQDVASIYASGQSKVFPVTKDRWGSWLSAFTPIKNDQGTIIAIFGLDVAASAYYSHIILNAIVPLLLTLLVVSLLLWLRRRALYQQQYITQKAFFLSFASHEIRSPLTSVSWALQAILHKSLPTEKSALFLQRAEHSVQHILSTIEDILSLQRTEGLATKKLNLTQETIHPLLKFTIDSLSLVSAEKDCEIIDTTNQADDGIIGLVDATLFKRVLSNLLVNALKYSPQGSPVEVGLHSTKNGWEITFHNGGEPISQDDQTKIFEGFYRTASAETGNQKGTGLGLMLCNDIINRHGGKLELDSSANTGTTFRITMNQQNPQRANSST